MQASRQWYAKMNSFLTSDLEMTQITADECIYIQKNQGSLLIIALYVDDLQIASNKPSNLCHCKEALNKRFKMIDLGESHMILGMEIICDRENRTLTLGPHRYTVRVFERLGIASAKGAITPMEPGLDAARLIGDPCFENHREAIGSLMYLVV